MQRPERIVMIGMGAIIHITFFKIALWLVAILTNFTVLQRIRSAYRQDTAESKGDAVLELKSEIKGSGS
jgi:hypothetical protein